MKAIEVRKPGGLDRIELVERAEPGRPGPGQILVRIRASSLNYHDYLIVTGVAKAADRRVPLSDGAGEVVEIGEGVDSFAVGDHVMSVFFSDWLDGAPRDVPTAKIFAGVPGDGTDGCACELVVAPATAFIPAPKGFSHAESATLVCAGLTAWRALVVEGRLKAGDVVLVQGTGGVSIFGLQIAKAMGATVVATSSSDEKLERLKALGADYVLNYAKDPKWGASAGALTGGVDHVLDVGGSGTLPQSFAATRIGGHVAMIGLLTGHEGPLPTMLMMTRQVRVTCMMVGSRRSQMEMVRAFEKNRIRPIIDRTFPLAELANAFRHQESGRHFGKIVVDI